MPRSSRRLQQWSRHRRQRMVGPAEKAHGHFRGGRRHQTRRHPEDKTGASPHNLLADTLGDELKLATQGQARVFTVSLKDRAAVLPGGFAADAAYWIEPKSGAWVTSTYYRTDLPKWTQDFNSADRAAKYWDREWKNNNGDLLRSTAHRKGKDGSDAGFYEVIGSTPFANQFELEFAKQLVVFEESRRRTRHRPARHQPFSQRHSRTSGRSRFAGNGRHGALARSRPCRLLQFPRSPDRPRQCMDRALRRPRSFCPADAAKKLRIPAANLGAGKLEAQINATLTAKFSPAHPASFIKTRLPRRLARSRHFRRHSRKRA